VRGVVGIVQDNHEAQGAKSTMNGPGITYEAVSDLLVKEIPELAIPYRELLEYWGDERPGPYIVYGDILNPYIDELLRDGNAEGAQRVFGFVESLLLSSDPRVADMAHVEICEHIVFSEENIWGKARPFMGEVTQKHCEQIRDWKP
jgi:hypothetical protein